MSHGFIGAYPSSPLASTVGLIAVFVSEKISILSKRVDEGKYVPVFTEINGAKLATLGGAGLVVVIPSWIQGKQTEVSELIFGPKFFASAVLNGCKEMAPGSLVAVASYYLLSYSWEVIS